MRRPQPLASWPQPPVMPRLRVCMIGSVVVITVVAQSASHRYAIFTILTVFPIATESPLIMITLR